MEFGILHLVDGENPQITVLVDCHGLSPLRFPMQTMRYCCNIFQDHFPNILGCLIVIRLPPVVRVIAQTVIQVSIILKCQFDMSIHTYVRKYMHAYRAK